MRVLATHSIRQFPLHFPSRASPCATRFQTSSTCKLINWYRTTWYLLCYIVLTLCLINRGSLCNRRRIHSMIPTIHWTYYKPKMMEGSICCNIHRSKCNILPTHSLVLAGIPWRYTDYLNTYTTWNNISSIGSTISFIRVIIFLFIIWERITSNLHILHTRNSVEWLQNFQPAEHILKTTNHLVLHVLCGLYF